MYFGFTDPNLFFYKEPAAYHSEVLSNWENKLIFHGHCAEECKFNNAGHVSETQGDYFLQLATVCMS